MHRVSTALTILVSWLMLSSCAAPTAEPVAFGRTPTAAPLPTFTRVARTEAVLATSTPLASVSALPDDFTPVLYGEKYDGNTFFFVLGGVRGDVWLAPEMTAQQLAAQAGDYDIYTLAEGPVEVRGQAPQFSPANQVYTVGTDVQLDEPGMVAVRRGWPILQRPVQELSSTNELYRQVVLEWLKGEGIAPSEPGSLHVFRVDLEGDRADEIFIGATHLDESQHTTHAGDYSLILMRKVVGNEVVTLPVVGDIYRTQEPEVTFPRAYALANFIDLNRDGVLEVVVDIQQWEGDGAIVYQVDGQDIVETGRIE
jgi:hypothetical protein